MTRPVLHLDFIALRPETGPQDREALLEAAAALASMPQVLAVGAIEAGAGSDFDLAVFFLLPDLGRLEPFGTDERYARFLQGSVAPKLKRFAGADVELDSEPAFREGIAACLALATPDETFDWEVREALEAWADAVRPAARAIGLAVGERQAFRGVALAFGGGAASAGRPADGRFRSTFVAGGARRL
ncbi:MAG TPA: hypothetical protein VNN21_05070 [Dehalococcoidia bacterium]|nr:hypothetical protein [Dehalococcoidia bacterium]